MVFSKTRSLVLLAAVALALFAVASAQEAPLHPTEHHDNPEAGQHKGFFPLSNRETIGLGLSAFFLMIAAGGGIGGGGILVPVYILVMGMPLKVAVPMASITIFGGAISNFYLNFTKRHPFADRPLIDWDLILMMEPLTIAGALVGSFMNIVLPAWVISVMLVILLTMTGLRSMQKGIKVYNKESKEIALAANNPSEPAKNGYGAVPNSDDFSSQVNENGLQGGEGKSDLERVLEEEAQVPYKKIAVIVTIFTCVSTLTLLKGGNGFNPLSVDCGTGLYWLLTIAILPVVLAVNVWARGNLVRRFHLKEAIGYEYAEGDVQWNERATIIYPSICAIAGLAAGLFGIGGGIVKGPLMLEMNVLPAVASASSATMILFTTGAASLSYYLFGSLNADYGVVLFGIGLVCTLIGQIVINALVRRYKRSSYIIFSISAVVLASAFCMGLQSSGAIIDYLQGHAAESRSLCGVAA